MTAHRVAIHAGTERKQITVLGATGSIGANTLNILDQHPNLFRVVALTAQNNAEALITLARTYKPQCVAIGNEAHYATVKEALVGSGIHVLAGSRGLEAAAAIPTDITVCAMVGAAGLLPAMRAIEQGKTVAVANKETLVCAGEVVMQTCRKYGTTLLPIDSEHNAIFQVFATEHRHTVERITLTASGGPFLHRPLTTMESITPEEAVAHPRWNMGAKVSVDSATMANKGLELMEAHYLFGMAPEQLDVLIHPESIVHSLVHYADGSVLAQLGMPDMRIPIGYALSWPSRLKLDTPRLNLAQTKALHFEHADTARFPALALARAALAAGPAHMITFNAANEVAVARFLNKDIPFTSITTVLAKVLEGIKTVPIHAIDDVLEADRTARMRAAEVC